jgi:1-acyl-sn-glycerol-3-phosphate acyltransferase
MDVSALAALGPAELRALLPGFLAAYVAESGPAERARAAAAGAVERWLDGDAESVRDRLVDVASDVRVWRAVPAGRDVARAYIGALLTGVEVRGVDGLDAAVAAGPVVVVCNHLSYVDTTTTDVALAAVGRPDLAERLFAAAGPKVYQELFRRVASICLDTLPVPQSGNLGYVDPLPPRDLARWVQQSLDAARQRLLEGGVLVLYAEGSRTRTGRMGSFLKGVHRYLAVHPEIAVVPAALSGTERLMPLGEERMHPASVSVRFGAPIPVAPLGSREALAAAQGAVAALLPEPLRPAVDTPPLA